MLSPTGLTNIKSKHDSTNANANKRKRYKLKTKFRLLLLQILSRTRCLKNNAIGFKIPLKGNRRKANSV